MTTSSPAAWVGHVSNTLFLLIRIARTAVDACASNMDLSLQCVESVSRCSRVIDVNDAFPDFPSKEHF
jgi:hypothetical protein